jgi:hypothetical protein
MKQHPIPQDITNYKFHLVGSMTLKQFAELAVAAVLAFIIYKTNLIDLVKWPLIFLTVGLGAAVAFVPIEERPLDHWIKTFFQNIYRPTKFFWKKSNKIPDFFNYKITSTQEDFFAPDINLNPARKKRIVEYLKSIPEEEQNRNQFDQVEEQKVQAVLSEFAKVEVDQSDIKIETMKQEKPSLQTRVRKLKAPQEASLEKKALPNQIFGQIFDADEKTVAGAIVEIKDQVDQTVRIIKSDASGNFLTDRPLENGTYQIIVEKDDAVFPAAKVELAGQTIKPLVIKP